LVGGISASILDGKNIEHSVKYGVAAGTMNTGVWDACYCKKKDIDNLFKKVKLKNCNGNL
jgi:fructose-1-phosphate kinase PfkB-like protein